MSLGQVYPYLYLLRYQVKFLYCQSHYKELMPDEPTVYRLTEDNLHTISPMIGLTEKEIATFFDVKQPN